MTAHSLARQIAQTILTGFDRHFRIFRTLTARAQLDFEHSRWQQAQTDSSHRIDFYDRRVSEAIERMRSAFHLDALDPELWQEVKSEYAHLLQAHLQPELAETFFNSVFCRLFDRRYYNNDYIFVWPATSTTHLEAKQPTFRSYYPQRDGLLCTFRTILNDTGLSLPWQDMRRDLRNVVQRIRQLHPDRPQPELNLRYLVLRPLFFRNKGAYLIGRVVNGFTEVPFVVAILTNKQGELYLDAILLGEYTVAQVFSFARAYFMVDSLVPSAVVNFLHQMLPSKDWADLYASIGFHKQGKNEFYRDFLHHLAHTEDCFIKAPGIEGLVMLVFTLPSYPYVFKVIRDRFKPPKDSNKKLVKEKYRMVKKHDRVGRMADTMEYTRAAFPLHRFDEKLLNDLLSEASEIVYLQDDEVVIDHLYIERRMVPLNIYLDQVDAEAAAAAINEYGNAIRDMAAANIFPGDLLIKNFGMTRQGRVVFYDYDEIAYLTDMNFRRIPTPRTPEDEMAAEPWYSVASNDVFPEEFGMFLFSDAKLKNIFLAKHAELLDAKWWQDQQHQISSGLLQDVFPYAKDDHLLIQL